MCVWQRPILRVWVENKISGCLIDVENKTMRKIIWLMMMFLTACVAAQYPLRDDVILFNKADNIFLRQHQKLPEVLPIYTTLSERGLQRRNFAWRQFTMIGITVFIRKIKIPIKMFISPKPFIWYEKAAANGHPIAQNDLALWYGVG